MDRKTLMLKVGDIVYAEYYGKIDGKYPITRVTKTQAITDKGTRFKRAYTEGYSHIDPYPLPTSWSSRSYRVGTPELEAKFLRTKMENVVGAIKTDKLTDDVLKQVYDILNQSK